MQCKPETEKQRLERIAVALMAAYVSNSSPQLVGTGAKDFAESAIDIARIFIKQLDALVLDE